MRISFSNRVAARAAASLFEQYGFSAKQIDTEVVTDCPTLLAAPAIERSIIAPSRTVRVKGPA